MERKPIAKASIDIDATAEKVWQALITPAAIKEYMFGTNVESDWREGADIVWQGEWQGKTYRDKGLILKFEPGKCLRYSHYSPLSGLADRPENYHTVTVELSARQQKTHLDLTQDNNASDAARAHSEKNWQQMLVGLKKYLED